MDNLIRYDMTVNGVTHTITGKYLSHIAASVYTRCIGLDHDMVTAQLDKLDVFEAEFKTNMRAKYAIANVPASNGIRFQVMLHQEEFAFVGLTVDEIFNKTSVFCNTMAIDMPFDEWLAFEQCPTGGECCICLQRQTPIGWTQTLCMHGFHTACIAEWKKTSATCPMCRMIL